MNKIIQWIARVAVGKQLMAGVAWAHEKLDGHRSQIATGLLVLVHALKIVKVIPEDQANMIEIALGAILPVTLADKVNKALKTADVIIPAVQTDPKKLQPCHLDKIVLGECPYEDCKGLIALPVPECTKFKSVYCTKCLRWYPEDCPEAMERLYGPESDEDE